MPTGQLHIGTSGWYYRHWVGPFYPAGMSPRAFLRHYAGKLRSVEINSTFYRLPARQALHTSRQATPADFRFACKASRFITHVKKLQHAEQGVARFLDTVETLGDKLGAILFQLPPRWPVDEGRLARFLSALPTEYRYAFEFRDRSWFTPSVYHLLGAHGAAMCVYHLDGWQSPVEPIADFFYLRLHGPSAPYRGLYDDQALHGWAQLVQTWRGTGSDVYCYFNNDEAGYAVQNALRLAELVDGA